MNKIIISWVIFIVVVAASLYAWGKAPDGMQLPIHWNIHGEVDGYLNAKTALWVMPALILFILMLMSFLAYFEPRKDNFKKSAKAREWIIFSITMFVAILALGNVAAVLGFEFVSFKLILASVMILLIIMGNFMPKLRSNYFIGIRTPWALSSEENWKKTHRLGGKVFMICGLLGLTVTFLVSDQNLMGILGATVLLPLIISPVAYSWYLWRQDAA